MKCTTCGGKMKEVTSGDQHNPGIAWCPACGTLDSTVGWNDMEVPAIIPLVKKLIEEADIAVQDCKNDLILQEYDAARDAIKSLLEGKHE